MDAMESHDLFFVYDPEKNTLIDLSGTGLIVMIGLGL